MSSAPNDVASRESDFDPVYVHSRHEAIVIFCAWAVCLLWAVPYCYFFGYSAGGEEFTLTMIWGIPSWVFWGILCPWLVAILFSTWFCFFYMKDDDLGEANEGADIEEEIAEMHATDKGVGQ